MNKGMQKLLSVVRTEGLNGTSERVGKLILSWLGLRISETLCYQYSFDSGFEIKEAIVHPSLTGIEVKLFMHLDEFRSFSKFPSKIAFLDIEEWFFKEAVCLSLICDSKVVAYAWLHPKQYHIKNAGTFHLEENEYFFGPAFTERNYRRKGLFGFIIENSLKYCKKNGIRHVYTTSSIENTPSIKCLTGYGFRVVGCVRSKGIKNREILEFNREKLVSQKLK